MNHTSPKFFAYCIEMLRTQIKQRNSLPMEARALTGAATAAGLTTLHLARFHEHVLLTEILVHVPPRQKPAMINRAAAFFATIVASKITTRSALKAEIIANREVARIRRDSITVLFRVAQEAITNIERYADAGRAKVCSKESSNKLIMSIVDDGKTFNADKFLRSRTNKLGLLAMREKTDMVGGSLSIESSSGIRTTITATIPQIKKAKAIPKGTKN